MSGSMTLVVRGDRTLLKVYYTPSR